MKTADWYRLTKTFRGRFIFVKPSYFVNLVMSSQSGYEAVKTKTNTSQQNKTKY